MKDIFFYGQSGSGKDTLANYFKEKHQYLKFRCAGTMKQVLSEKNGLTATQLEVVKRQNESMRKAHWTFGDWYNNGKKHEAVLQRLRNIMERDSIEFDIIPEFMKRYPIIISDVRVMPEMQLLLDNGFVGVFLTRKTAEYKKDKHSTENDMFMDGTIAKLCKRYPRQCVIVFNDIHDNMSLYTARVNEHLKKFDYTDALNVVIADNPDGIGLVNIFSTNVLQIIPTLFDDKNAGEDDNNGVGFMSR